MAAANVIQRKAHHAVQNRKVMGTWIDQAINFDNAPVLVLMAVFLMGVLSVFTCACNFSIIGVVAGYSGATIGQGKPKGYFLKGLSFLTGTIISMSVIGALFGYAGNWAQESLGKYGQIAAGLVAILFGLYSMDIVPVKLPDLSLKSKQSQANIFASVIIGFSVGGLSAACNTCCNPFFPVILAASFVKGSAVWGFIMLAVFALGFGIPLAAIIIGMGLGLGGLSARLSLIVKIVKFAGGIAMVALGFYLLLTF